MSQFKVVVGRDDRIPEKDYTMGFEPLWNHSDVEVVFLPERSYHELKPTDVEGANAIIVVEDLVTADTVRASDDIQVVVSFGSGIDNLDIEGLTELGIPCVNSPQGVDESVAQSTLGMLIACASNSIAYNNLVRRQGFEGRWENMGITLYEKTVGTVGMGMIGAKLTELLKPFGVEMLTYDPYLSEERAAELGVELVDFETLLAESDFISIHCPLTNETRRMFGTEEFEQMRESAYFVNTSRGGVHVDADLAAAVEKETIAGAAVDVYEDEPNVEGNMLLDLDDCWLTPHTAGLLVETLTKHGHLASESILSVFDNEIPNNIINPEIYDEPMDESLLSPSHRGDATGDHYRN